MPDSGSRSKNNGSKKTASNSKDTARTKASSTPRSPPPRSKSASRSKTPSKSKSASRTKSPSGTKDAAEQHESAGEYLKESAGYYDEETGGYPYGAPPPEGEGPPSRDYRSGTASPPPEGVAQRTRPTIDWSLFPFALAGFAVGLVIGIVIVVFFGFCICIFGNCGAWWRDRKKRAFLGGFATGVLIAVIVYIALFIALLVDDDGPRTVVCTNCRWLKW